ncbi:MAG: SinI family restriction endonuclease [Sphaerochaeta sp.]|nr:MAG: SinI family restriction endonuclease [Sphaerochaeta sp.]
MNDTSDSERNRMKARFLHGYNNRPSVRVTNRMRTKSDPIVDTLIQARLDALKTEEILFIRFGHRLSMAAENIIGLILEEYIHCSALQHGWTCCWGSAIPSVDFCSSEGTLLQIKNRSNTENSSSNKIRVGTEIRIWFRLSAYTGETRWDGLNDIIGEPDLMSEKGFHTFAADLIRRNPSVLFVEEELLHLLGRSE